jgi:GntR family transcriptional regulator/MocR family aminotransferase
MEPIFELNIVLPTNKKGNLRQSIYRQLKIAIIEGRLSAGIRLPPSRLFAEQLLVSRNTVMAVYDLLINEGYLETTLGAGTFVAYFQPENKLKFVDQNITRSKDNETRLAAFWRNPDTLGKIPAQPPARFDFRVGSPDLTLFPFEIWRRILAKTARQQSGQQRQKRDHQGQQTLRHAIAIHLSLSRAVACTSEDIIVTSGAQQALDILARILVTPGKTQVAIEHPGYPMARQIFCAAGANIINVPVDNEGIVVEDIPSTVKVIYLTPSHQFPLGVAMSAKRRAALLDFAQTNNVSIIEDDYDSEFRFGERPLDALQTQDRGNNVFYVGTFSKTMFADLRVGFVVMPFWAKEAMVTAKFLTDWHNPPLLQEALATFINQGHLGRHIRKVRKLYKTRYLALLNALTLYCEDRLRPIPIHAGVHLTALLVDHCDAQYVAKAAAQAGVSVRALEEFTQGESNTNGLVFGFGCIEASDINQGIRIIGNILKPSPNNTRFKAF